MQEIVARLIDHMKTIPVVDGHQHLDNEPEMLARPVDVFHRLTMYTYAGLQSAGMKVDIAYLRDVSAPIEERWSHISPLLDFIRDTGVYRAMQITLQDLYGFDDLTDDNYLAIQEAMKKKTKPGFYDWVLKEKCNIVRILNQGSWNDGRKGYAVGVSRDFIGLQYLQLKSLQEFCRKWEALHGGPFDDPADLVDFALKTTTVNHAGVKFWSNFPPGPIDDSQAGRLYKKMKAGPLTESDCRELSLWLVNRVLARVPQYNLTVALHCGLGATAWWDFTTANPFNMIQAAIAYRDTRFDLYHGGIPWMREIGVIANQYPNVNLNLTWCHQLSPYMTEACLQEWIDVVPANKIIGFGGDHSLGVEKIYGALVLARENIARPLAERIKRGQMTEERAAEICRMWLHDNPLRIYNLI